MKSETLGIKCPKCNSTNNGVQTGYNMIDEAYMKERLRVCRDCGERFRTIERYDEAAVKAYNDRLEREKA